jgi:hypothetical protein
MSGTRLGPDVAVFRNLVGHPLHLYRSMVVGLRSCGLSIPGGPCLRLSKDHDRVRKSTHWLSTGACCCLRVCRRESWRSEWVWQQCWPSWAFTSPSCGLLPFGTSPILDSNNTPLGPTRSCGRCLQEDLWPDTGASVALLSRPSPKQRCPCARHEAHGRRITLVGRPCSELLLPVTQ